MFFVLLFLDVLEQIGIIYSLFFVCISSHYHQQQKSYLHLHGVRKRRLHGDRQQTNQNNNNYLPFLYVIVVLQFVSFYTRSSFGPLHTKKNTVGMILGKISISYFRLNFICKCMLLFFPCTQRVVMLVIVCATMLSEVIWKNKLNDNCDSICDSISVLVTRWWFGLVQCR